MYFVDELHSKVVKAVKNVVRKRFYLKRVLLPLKTPHNRGVSVFVIITELANLVMQIHFYTLQNLYTNPGTKFLQKRPIH